jgi:hypothetical protein
LVARTACGWLLVKCLWVAEGHRRWFMPKALA